MDAPAQPVKRKRSALRELLETAVLTVAIFLLVRVAVQNFRVEGFSMLPNLQNGEYILVDKVDYMIHSPERGDIVVLKAIPAGEPDKDFIKRVIGLPGETVAVKNESVYINGRRLIEPYQHYPFGYTFGPLKVPSGEYFVLGDHRDDSYDSHRWSPPWLPRSDIIGKALVAYWPPNDVTFFRSPSYSYASGVRSAK
jgi:signal peptidase I